MSFGECFLAYPDLFPERNSGERWGGRRLGLDLAGGPYVVSGLSEELASAVATRFAPLVGEAPSAALPDVEVFRVAPSDFRRVATAGWEYRLDFDLREGALRLAGLDLMARLAPLPRGRAALWTPAGDGPRFLGTFENLLRVLVAYRLLGEGGVLLHSAGIVAHGRAYVFFGHSGAGKTTFSGLSARAGHDVISDELNLLWTLPDGVRVESLPFAGDFGQRCRPRTTYPLGGLFLLEKGPPAARRPLSLARGVAALAACSPVVNTDPHRSPVLLENLERLARASRPEALAFELVGNPWDMLAP